MPGGRVLAVAARQLAVLGIVREQDRLIGAVGATAFLVYAWANIDRLRGLGLDHACWRSAARANWVLAAVSGIAGRHHCLRDRDCFGTKHEAGRQLEAHRPPGDAGAGARGDRVPRLSVRVPDVVVEQGSQLTLAGAGWSWFSRPWSLLWFISRSPASVGYNWRASRPREPSMAGSGGALDRRLPRPFHTRHTTWPFMRSAVPCCSVRRPRDELLVVVPR